MFVLKSIRLRHFHLLLKLQNPPPLTTHPISSNFNQSWILSSISQRPFSLSSQSSEKIETEPRNSQDFDKKRKKRKKPLLDVVLKDDHGGGGVKGNNSNKSSTRSLSSFFAKEEDGAKSGKKSGKFDGLRMENPGVFKELSPDMFTFVTHLYKQGYFKDSNFLPKDRLEMNCFQNRYARDFVKSAAQQFGKDNQEIAKWLSASDLKKVASFGCPSLGRRSVFSAKNLRRFFRIQENIVCSKCTIKDSCKFANQSVWKSGSKSLQLASVMRVITLYGLESVPSQLIVPEEIKLSVTKLLKEVVDLSQTV